MVDAGREWRSLAHPVPYVLRREKKPKKKNVTKRSASNYLIKKKCYGGQVYNVEEDGRNFFLTGSMIFFLSLTTAQLKRAISPRVVTLNLMPEIEVEVFCSETVLKWNKISFRGHAYWIEISAKRDGKLFRLHLRNNY